MGDWNKYFRNLLRGVEWRVMKGTNRSMEEDGEKELDRKEVEKVIGRLKDDKVTGGDSILNEVWKYGGGEKVKERIWDVCRRVWRGESWPEG